MNELLIPIDMTPSEAFIRCVVGILLFNAIAIPFYLRGKVKYLLISIVLGFYPVLVLWSLIDNSEAEGTIETMFKIIIVLIYIQFILGMGAMRAPFKVRKK